MLFLSDLCRQECHRYTTVFQVSTLQLLGWVTDETDVYLRRQLSLFLSSHGMNTRFRTFKVRGGLRQHLHLSEYTEGIRSSHGSRARKNETRTSYCSNARRDQARTSHCVREETKRLHAAPSARTKQKDQFARFDVRGRTLVLGRIYQAEWVRKPAIRNTTPIDNPARQNV